MLCSEPFQAFIIHNATSSEVNICYFIISVFILIHCIDFITTAIYYVAYLQLTNTNITFDNNNDEGSYKLPIITLWLPVPVTVYIQMLL